MKFVLLAVITWTVILHVVSKSQLNRVVHLSTFRTENLRIRAPTKRFASIVDEAIWLMRTHFIKRHLLSRKDWENLSAQFADCPDVNKVRNCYSFEVYDWFVLSLSLPIILYRV